MVCGYILAICAVVLLQGVSCADSGHNDVHPDLILYQNRTKTLLELLRTECSHLNVNRFKREVISYSNKTSLEAEKIVFANLTRKLMECRQKRSLPVECQTAINLTESWRRDHEGGKKQVDHKQLTDYVNAGRPWFRFSGEAGQKMLDKCPPEESCGVRAGIWTNEEMPSSVGIGKYIKLFASYNNNCTNWVYDCKVMRCSLGNNYDFVYKYYGINGFAVGFCGMEA